MSDKMISIASDFSTSPAGRTPADGPFNGQRFREQFLVPALRVAIANRSKVIVDMDGAFSYSSSFLEEAFGGLARLQEFRQQDIRERFEIKSVDPIYAGFYKDARKYLDDALKTRAQ